MAGGLTSYLRNSYAALGSKEEKHAEREDRVTEEKLCPISDEIMEIAMRNCPSINKDIT